VSTFSSEGYGASGATSLGSDRPSVHTETNESGSASLGQLLGEVTKDLSTLMRQEVALAKAEIRQDATKAGKGAGMLGGAGFAGYMVLLFASIAAWWGLATVVPNGWAALIVTAIWAVIGAILYQAGRRQMRQVHPIPERTTETLKEIPDALKPS
jgi:tetrahydromethanopterin S-methyltransferase subunit C